MSGKILTFENVYYSYPKSKKPALENINLSLDEGEFLAVTGENGSGKTTFCKLINGIIPHICGGQLEGNITVDGINTASSDVPRLSQIAGMVLDDPDAQIFTSSVRGETAFGPENLLLPPQEIEERVKWALSVTGLAGFENRQPAKLSGGEKQRLSIAAALAMKSKLLVLDEPLCRLDPQGAEETVAVLKNLNKNFGITVVIACADSRLMQDAADNVCVLKNGKITVFGAAKNIYSNRVLLEENGIRPPVEIGLDKIFTLKANSLSENEKAAAIKIENLSYSYDHGVPVIENINLSIADNDFAAIIGSNGCGKTTLLKNITGLLQPEGDIYIRGRNAKGLSVSGISKEIGFVMQNSDAQLFTDSVYKEVSFALKNARLSKQEIKLKTEDALRAAGLDDWDAFPHALERADRTKTVIACVLAMGCKILIFDEVDIGQDYRGALEIMDTARGLHSKGYTVIFVTHNMSLVCEYARRLITMDRKGIIADMRRR